MWNQSRRLYVAEFKNGVIKVGITNQPGLRREKNLRWLHYRPSRVHYCAHNERGFWSEQQVICRMRRIANTSKGREWFTGARFEAVRLLADQVTRSANALTAAEARA